ncbi:MAG: excinuclease ABC subunit UvrC [Porphyromonadaceae bacterium]|nr:excinuclease ABC subunit UvrC [Porphyromonadaceae bacterium]
MTLEEIRQILPTLPESPGCYKYFNAEGVIIYVGKAKNLRRRVSSYFHKEHTHTKTKLLVRQIKRLEYVVVDTEFDALLLENALIKEHQPRYNVLLKDGKTYPEIIIKNEPFPRVLVERRAARDGSLRFGPYPSVQMARATLAMVQDIYPLRTCTLDLRPHKIADSRYKECLQYHIKRCKAPCVGGQAQEDYDANIREIASLLRGELSTVIDLYREEMMQLASELRFEEAQVYKERLEQLEKYQVKHTVAPHHIDRVDVFSMDRDDKHIYVNYLHISQGMVVRAQTVEFAAQLNESDQELLSSIIVELRRRFDSPARELIVPFHLDWELAPRGVVQTVPQRGDKKRLLELSERNVRQYKVDKYKQAERLNPDQRMMQTLGELRDALGLEGLPKHIECFDNSNIQGSSSVAACVVFRQARPSKKDYRKYHIRSVEGADDYASMREIALRRYVRIIETKQPLPDLILVDGGKGQIGALLGALEELGLSIPVAGLAKDNRHQTRELLYGSPLNTIPIKHQSATFLLLEHIQSEVHRFAITFHRDVRSKGQLISKLDYIKGIGPKTKDQLLTKFKSVRRLHQASLEELSAVVGEKKARLIHEAFHVEQS